MNKILVVVSFVFVSFLSCTGLTDRQRLANQILSDTNLLKVDSMAPATPPQRFYPRERLFPDMGS